MEEEMREGRGKREEGGSCRTPRRLIKNADGSPESGSTAVLGETLVD